MGPSGGAATILEKGKTAIRGGESEDVEILDFPEERQLIFEPPVREPVTLLKLHQETGQGQVVRWIPLPSRGI